jgi:hypothetical protein
VTTFFDHYSAGDQGLAEHEWKSRSKVSSAQSFAQVPEWGEPLAYGP